MKSGMTAFEEKFSWIDFKQFVPSATCLSCDGCCRFKDEHSPWRPKILAGEKPGLAEQILTGGGSADSHVKIVERKGQCQCVFFEAATHVCSVYAGRPFECRLYPFVLTRWDDHSIALTVHLPCPYVARTRYTDAFESYVEYLKSFFSRPAVEKFFRDSREEIADYAEYRDELEYVFAVSPRPGKV